MCAIFGFITQSNKYNQEHLQKMSDLLFHRGPDDRGFYNDKDIFIGHNRLSIIDLSQKGKQPMANEDKSIWLTYNGEIYNFQELKKELINKGHKFLSNTDTEVIIHAYEEYGIKCLEKFNGMFAFALFDKKKNQLILARDRMGIKPLYYLKTFDLFAFSSEIKGFKVLGDLKLNQETIKKLLGFPYLPDNTQTTLENIYKIPPAHYLIYNLNNKKIIIKPYWHLKFNKEVRKLNFQQAAEELEKLLIKSVNFRLIADVPLGIMLSGGLDSSVIAALAQKYNKDKINTFTAGFKSRGGRMLSEIDERKYAKLVADYIGSNHQEVLIEPKEVIDHIENFIEHFDDLNTFDGGLLTNYLIAEKMHQEGIKVILLGEGADEIFGGYSWFGLSKLPFNLLPKSLKKRLYCYSISRNLSFAPANYFQNINRLFPEKNTFDMISNYEITMQLPNNYLMKVDKGTMACSVEARVPYLDHNIVEFVYSLKPAYKLKGNFQSFGKINEKYILRELAKKYLPLSIAMRKKKGGMLPIADIIKSNISKIKDYLLEKNSLSTQIFGRKKIERLFKNDIKNIGKSNWRFYEVEREIFLWKLFLLEVWRKSFLER